jgi:hypothetical protein
MYEVRDQQVIISISVRTIWFKKRSSVESDSFHIKPEEKSNNINKHHV